MHDERLVRKTYSEIVAGHTVTKYNGDFVFIKHFSPIDLLEFDYKYEQILKDSIKKGIPTEEESIKSLCKNGLWDQTKEEDIKNTREMISMLYFNKRKHYAPQEINSFNNQIKENEDHLVDLLMDRNSKIGATAEIFSRKKVETQQIFYSFFHDPALTSPVFKEDDWENFYNEDAQSILEIYQNSLESVSHKMLRLAALSDDFQSMYSMSNSVFEFYGKPISKLTKSQIDLVRYGNYYKTILSEEFKPPQEILSDPDKLEDWYTGRANITELIEKNNTEDDGKTISIVGVSKKDLNFYGIAT